MNKIKLLFATLFTVCFLSVTQNVKAETRDDGWMFVECPASSGNVTGLSLGKKCRVKKVYASTAPYESEGSYFILVDTQPKDSLSGKPTFETKQYRSPAVKFAISTQTANGSIRNDLTEVLDYGEDGVNFSTAPYIYKSHSSLGEARRVFLLLKQ